MDVWNEDKRKFKRRIYREICEKASSHAILIAFRSRIRYFPGKVAFARGELKNRDFHAKGRKRAWNEWKRIFSFRFFDTRIMPNLFRNKTKKKKMIIFFYFLSRLLNVSVFSFFQKDKIKKKKVFKVIDIFFFGDFRIKRNISWLN